MCIGFLTSFSVPLLFVPLYGVLLRLVATRTAKGDLLLIATDLPGRDALPIYALRWKIECLFEQFKSHGFDLEAAWPHGVPFRPRQPPA